MAWSILKDNPTGNWLGYITGLFGFAMMEIEAMTNLDLALSILLKFTSLISFVVFVFLNYFKVKDKIKAMKKKKKKKYV